MLNSYILGASRQSSVVWRVSLFGLFPVLVSVIMSSFLSSCVCLIIYDYPVYL